MDAVSAFRRARLVAAAAGVGASACGAAPPGEGPQAPGAQRDASDVTPARGLSGGPARASGERITGGDPAQVHQKIVAALGDGGHACRVMKDRVACQGDKDQGAAFYVVYREYPARLLFASPWLLKGTCADALPAINHFNWAFDELNASCDDRGAVVVSGAYFVPEGGLTARDVLGFARWWSLSEVRALAASEVAPLLR